MSYTAREVPSDINALPIFLQDELYKIALALVSDEKYSSVQFLHSGSIVNTRFKAEGVRFWDSSNLRPIWAQGSSPTSPWIDALGTVVYQPI